MASSEDRVEYAIEVENVSKSFRVHSDQRSTAKEIFVRGRSKKTSEFKALDDVSFKIRKGTTFGLIGHNGSGKSTMLKILAGVYRPSSGSVRVTDSVDALLELGAGFHGELTGRENIYLNGAILGRTKKQIDDSLDWIIDFADIGAFIDEPVKVYSSGMAVRLGFAVAVAVTPTILIVDEIIAVGDENFQRKCFEFMRLLREKGTTIALVTHSLSLAQEMCDECVWFDHGKVRKIGPSHEVVSAYLEEVNEQENTARAASIGASDQARIDDYHNRQGTGECRIQSVEYYDAERQRISVLSSAKPATVRLIIDAYEEMDEIEVGIAVTTDTGLVVAGPNSKHSGVLYDLPAGTWAIDYRIEDLIVQPGHYWLTGALHRRGQAVDYAEKLEDFVVRADHVIAEPGLVCLPPGTWSSVPVQASLKEGEDHE
nr:ABC transporter ATP-binding protein [Schaalia cardiffensis]